MEGTFYRGTGDYPRAVEAFLARLEEIDKGWEMVLQMQGGQETDFSDQLKMNYLRGRANLLMELAEITAIKGEKEKALGFAREAREAGKVRFAGYSGDNAAGVYAASLPDIAVIETSVNFCDQANLESVIPACQANDVGVIAKRPIANAAWKNLSDQRGMYQNYASEYHRRFNKMGITPHDLGYHGHPEVEWPEIALKFTLAQAGVHTAICGTTSLENAEHNLAAANKNPLREEVVEKLKAAFAKARDADPDGDWAGRT